MRRWLLTLTFCLIITLVVPTSAQDDNPQYPVITPDNIHQLTEIQRIGHGYPNNARWMDDGSIQVFSSLGIFRHDGDSYEYLYAEQPTTYRRGTWSPDRTKLVWKDDRNSRLYLFDTANRTNHAIVASRIAVSWNSIYWSHDSAKIAVIPYRNRSIVYIWNVADRKLARIIDASPYSISQVAWSPDGSRLATGSSRIDEPIVIWDMTSGAQLQTFDKYEIWLGAMAFSPDGNMLVVSEFGEGDQAHLYVWNALTGNLNIELGADEFIWGPIRELRWSPDGTRLATSEFLNACIHPSDNLPITIWDVDSGLPIQELGPHHCSVTTIQWSPDGNRILSVAAIDSIRVWDANTGQQLAVLQGYVGAYSLAWANQSPQIAIGTGFGYVQIWDTAQNKPVQLFEPHTYWIDDVAWSPDDHYLATTGNNSAPLIWDMNMGELISDNMGIMSDLDWSPDGTRLATSHGWIFRMNDQLSTAFYAHDECCVWAVDWSPDNSILAFGRSNGDIDLWNMATQQRIAILSGYSTGITSLAWSPNGRRLASTDRDSQIVIWDWQSAHNDQIIFQEDVLFYDVSWSPDGTILSAISSDGTVHFWQADANAPPSNDLPHFHTISDAQLAPKFSPDGTMLALGNAYGTISIYAVTE